MTCHSLGGRFSRFIMCASTAFTGFETSNKYTVKNSMGQKVFHAAEISDCCTRQLCGPNRAFDMKIVDNHDHEVIHLNRALACSSCFFPCCLQASCYLNCGSHLSPLTENVYSTFSKIDHGSNCSTGYANRVYSPRVEYSQPQV